MTDDTKQDERCSHGWDRDECPYTHPLRDTDPEMVPLSDLMDVREELAALRAELEAERVAVKLACGKSVDLRAELAFLRAENVFIHKRDSELWREAQGKIDTLKQRWRDVRAERDAYREDADHYRAAIERWYDLSMQKNINGTDGPSDEWMRAVDALKTIATGESHD